MYNFIDLPLNIRRNVWNTALKFSKLDPVPGIFARYDRIHIIKGIVLRSGTAFDYNSDRKHFILIYVTKNNFNLLPGMYIMKILWSWGGGGRKKK